VTALRVDVSVMMILDPPCPPPAKAGGAQPFTMM